MLRALAVAVLGTAALALPAFAEDGGSVLRFVPSADVAIIDPYFSGVYITRNYGYMVYDTLLAIDSSFRVRPQMADWKVEGLSEMVPANPR